MGKHQRWKHIAKLEGIHWVKADAKGEKTNQPVRPNNAWEKWHHEHQHGQDGGGKHCTTQKTPRARTQRHWQIRRLGQEAKKYTSPSQQQQSPEYIGKHPTRTSVRKRRGPQQTSHQEDGSEVHPPSARIRNAKATRRTGKELEGKHNNTGEPSARWQ